MKRIAADPARCLACRTCELACALAHAGTGDLVEAIYRRGAKPRIYIEVAGKLAVPLQCRHCQDAPCVRVCTAGALWRADAQGPVLVRQERCIGCGFCMEACPFGVIRVERSAEPATRDVRAAVIKCDLCADRLAEGLDPACVASCPVGALSWEEAEDRAQRARQRTAAQVASRGF